MSSEADFDLHAVAASALWRQMEVAGYRLNIMLLDACRDRFRASRKG